MEGYKRGIGVAWVLIFIGAWICYVAHYGFLPGLEHGWWAAGIAASVLCLIWPLPVLLVIAALVWILPQPRLSAH